MDTTPESKGPLSDDTQKKPLITMPVMLGVFAVGLFVLLILLGQN